MAPNYQIKIILYKIWQAKSILIPKRLTNKFMEVLKVRYEKGVLKEGHGPYRNPWFLVKKKDGGLRLINLATRINGIFIRNTFLFKLYNKLVISFVIYKIIILVDLFSGYNQISLYPNSRNITAFITPIRLLKMTTLF